MRKIYALILLVSGVAFGQERFSGEAYYVLRCSYSLGDARDGCGFGGLEWLHLIHENGETPYLKPDDDTTWHNTYGTFGDVTFTESNPVIRFKIYSTKRHKNSAGACSEKHARLAELPIQRYETRSYVGMVEDGGALAFGGTITMNTFPVINLKNNDTINTLIGTDSPLIIPEIPGVAPQYFEWEYHIEGDETSHTYWVLVDPNCVPSNQDSQNPQPCPEEEVTVWTPNWHRLPEQYQGINRLAIDACKNVFPGEAVGKQISIRANSNGLGKIINLDYTVSAPDIVSAIPSQPTCFKDQNGTLKLTFNRKLLPNETLSIDLTPGDDLTNITIPDDRTYTITGLDSGEYKLKLSGFLNETNTFSSTGDDPLSFTIGYPTPVSFLLSKTDVRCHGGSDGTITITAWGGTGNDNGYKYTRDNGATWHFFNNTENSNYNPSSITLTNLNIGTYTFKVKDGNGCIAKMPNGNENKLSETISQPAAPVTIAYTFTKEPTFFGATNGQLVAVIRGGTAYPGGSYTYDWVNEAGVSQNSKTTTLYNAVDKTYTITLDGIPAGKYYLTVKDKNFDPNKDNTNCTQANSEKELQQPPKLVVTFEVQQTISCNAANTFGNETDINPYDGQRDESQDGVLVAHVTGGVPFTGSANNGLPYQYFWKKEQTDGSWIAWNDHDETAQHISDGRYALNIKDANGIMLGTYNVNNELAQERDSIQSMTQPERLELAFTKGAISCGAGNDGWAKANLTGGTYPYTYQWTNGETTETITGLTTNNYFVRITDAKGCSSQGSVLVEQPDGVVAHETVKSPNCFQGSDGSILLSPTGGVAPYQYAWSTAAISAGISNLPAGNYSVTITDANACNLIQHFTLTDPEPLVVNLGADRTLCNAQSLELDTTIADSQAHYNWTSANGFTADTAKVSLTAAGVYQAKVTSGLGCIGEDTIEIKTSTVDISSEFFLSSQAYIDEEVVLVNVSNPFGENTQWIIPEGVTVVEQKDKYIVLKFNAIGMYPIGLKQTQGDCYAVYSKNIQVETRNVLRTTTSSNALFITDFIVTPNPSDGNFRVVVNLENSSGIHLRLFSSRGEYVAGRKIESNQKSHVADFTTTLSAGLYILVLETPQQTLVKKIIIY